MCIYIYIYIDIHEEWDGEESMRSVLQDAFKALDGSKGASWSQVYGCQSKADFVAMPDAVGVVMTSLVMHYIYDPVWLSGLDAIHLNQLGLLDPEGVKIMSEIHPVKKSDIGRWRLIWLVSVRTEMIDRLLHSTQNNVELSMYQADYSHSPAFPTFGAAVGMGHHDDGLAQTARAMKRLGLDKGGTCLDCSQWDMNQTPATMYADGWRRASLAWEGGANEAFCRAQLVRAVVMSRHLIVIGQDVCLVTALGIVGSGLLSTAAINSFIRALLHSAAYWDADFKAGREPQVANSLTMGDDLVCNLQVTEENLLFWKNLGLIMDPDDQFPVEDGVVYFTSHENNFCFLNIYIYIYIHTRGCEKP